MTAVSAADLPEGSIVAGHWLVFVKQQNGNQPYWRCTDARSYFSGQVQEFLDSGAAVLRHGYGDQP